MNLSIFEVLVLVGVVQGFVIAVLVWSGKTRSLSKRLLAFILLVFNFLCIKVLLHTTGLWQTRWFRYMPLAVELAVQPLIWLYIASLTRPGFRFRKAHLGHFIPFACSMAYSLVVYFAVSGSDEIPAKDAVANSFYFNQVKEAEDYLTIFSAIGYWVLGMRLLLRYRRWLYTNISDTRYPAYDWLKTIAVLLGILIAGLGIAICLDHFFHFGAHHFLHWQLFFGYLSVLIYYMGFRGYQLPDKPLPAAEETYRDQADQQPLLPEHIVREAAWPDEKGLQLREAIRNALEVDQLYLDPEISLQRLAKRINANPAVVSRVINNSFGKNFRNLINVYRIEKVKQRLKDTEAGSLSLLGIAYECGFNSEASFYRVFKAATGLSPKEYSKQDTPAE